MGAGLNASCACSCMHMHKHAQHTHPRTQTHTLTHTNTRTYACARKRTCRQTRGTLRPLCGDTQQEQVSDRPSHVPSVCEAVRMLEPRAGPVITSSCNHTQLAFSSCTPLLTVTYTRWTCTLDPLCQYQPQPLKCTLQGLLLRPAVPSLHLASPCTKEHQPNKGGPCA